MRGQFTYILSMHVLVAGDREQDISKLSPYLF